MINLATNYLGLTLKSPLIVSSSGLTNSINKIRKFEELGAGAVVLKS
jgi:dihydroorotate dehydrogenase (fumarate)